VYKPQFFYIYVKISAGKIWVRQPKLTAVEEKKQVATAAYIDR